MSDWARALLKDLGIPVTSKNLKLLRDWQRWEGGHTNNTATYNWLNTTRGSQYPVMAGGNTAGVRAYPDFQTGIKYTADTIRSGYPSILSAMQSGNPYAQQFRSGVSGDLSKWVSGSRTGNPKYARKVLGDSTPAPDTTPAPDMGEATEAPENPTRQRTSRLREALEQDLFGDDPNAMALLFSIRKRASDKDVQNAGLVDDRGSLKPPPAAKTNPLIAAADTQIGKPYVFGSGPDTSSFDCSDLIQWAYKQIGVELPRTTFDQIKVGRAVKWGQFQPGDLIFSNKGGHVVMYVGDGKVIAAPRTGQTVQYQPVSRFKTGFVTARRVL